MDIGMFHNISNYNVPGEFIQHNLKTMLLLIKQYVEEKDPKIKQDQKEEINFLVSKFIGVECYEYLTKDWVIKNE